MQSSAVAAELERWLPALERAIRRTPFTRETLQSLTDELLAGRATLWAADRSCAVTQLVLTPEGERQLHFWLCGGDLAEILQVIPLVEAWGRQQGCTVATIQGRPGWARALKPRGYAPADDLLRKAL